MKSFTLYVEDQDDGRVAEVSGEVSNEVGLAMFALTTFDESANPDTPMKRALNAYVEECRKSLAPVSTATSKGRSA